MNRCIEKNSYSFFDPNTGEKLDTDICQNDTIILKGIIKIEGKEVNKKFNFSESTCI